MNYWLVKSEPAVFSWERFVKEGKAVWDGVRNYQARNYMKNMCIDDLVLFYHSNTGKEIVGIAKVIKETYPDPTADNIKWVAVDLVPVSAFKKFVNIEQIKINIKLKDLLLIKQSRLSVMPLSEEHYRALCKMGL